MRRWSVGGALIPHADGLVLVSNRRRSGALEWTPPGGVIDPGESVLDGLTREVREETGLIVSSWSHLSYTVVVEAPDMGWRLGVEAWVVDRIDGEVCIDDLLAEPTPSTLELPTVHELDADVIFCTSGTTGVPKGVVLSHR